MKIIFKEGVMRKIILLIAIVVMTCQAADTLLKQETLKDYLVNGAPFDFILVDLRGIEEITTVIGNETCKPYNLAWPAQFQKECARIPKDQRVIVYCRSGGRAGNALNYLVANGYTNAYSAGGMLTWDGPTLPPSEIKPIELLPEASMKAARGNGHLSKQLSAMDCFAMAFDPGVQNN
jgi:rhodanese-related sulfurtransferase